jgi:hypothetical protein
MTTETNPIRGKCVVAVVTRDHADVWHVEAGATIPLFHLDRQSSIDNHRHVRPAQENHGHSSVEGLREFFESIANALSEASEIFLVGHGVGKADTALEFAAYAQKSHPKVAAAVSETHREDVSRLTPGQIIALARKWKDSQTVRP